MMNDASTVSRETAKHKSVSRETPTIKQKIPLLEQKTEGFSLKGEELLNKKFEYFMNNIF